jgi:cysteine desulfurase
MTAARTYLDYNASAPLREEARVAMLAAFAAPGNPSSVHAEGRRARAIIETAREEVARLINARPSEVVFTSGATEGNNCVMAAGWETICVSGIEHDSVLAPARASGARLIELPASTGGVAELQAIAGPLKRAAEGSGRVLLSLMLANNETGVIQPVAAATALARELGAAVHVDAVQGPGRIPVDFAALGADTLVLSAHKLGGPRGVGALVIRDGVSLPAFVKGGGQERRRRGGTENVSGIAGFGAAAQAVAREKDVVERMGRLRAMLEDGVLRATPAAVIVGKEERRIANTSCIAMPGKPAETLVIKLDLEGLAVSAGAACSSGKVGPSHVLEAMGLAPEITRSAIRVSLGPQTGEKDIAAFLAAWDKVAGRAAIAA